MFKFLRKYNKWILAVGGTLLLIVFLIPQAIQGLSQRAAVSSASWAVIDGEEISQREASQARDEAEVIDRLQRSGIPVIRGIDFIDTAEHWYLLVREADQVGLVGSNATVNISPDQLAPGLNPALILRTQARANGVSRMVGLFGSAAPLSDRRLRQEAQRLFHTVGAQIVVIEADPDAAVDEPTEAEIEAQLEAFADVAAGEGERGFGYRLPNRFKIEWLTIGVDDVRSMIENSEAMNGVALRRHWRRQESASGFPPVEDGAPVPDVVREDLLEQLTADKLDEIAKFSAQQLQNRRRGLPEAEGYTVLPDDWETQRLALTELAELLQQKYEIPLPSYEAVGDRWLSMTDLADLGAVAEATTDKFGTPAGLAQLINASREFEGSVTLVTQAGVAGPPMRLSDDSIVLFRVTDVDPARPPESVDEVRDAVVADLRRARHFDQLLEQQESIASRARDEGLLAVALEHDTVVQPRTNVSLANASDVVTYARAGLVPPRRLSILPSTLR